MDEIILKAYADCIVDSLIERQGGHTSAAVALGETNYEADETGDILQQSVKFYWETYNTRLGHEVDKSYQTVISVRVDSGQVSIGASRDDWDVFTPQTVHSSADWLVQQEFSS